MHDNDLGPSEESASSSIDDIAAEMFEQLDSNAMQPARSDNRLSQFAFSRFDDVFSPDIFESNDDRHFTWAPYNPASPEHVSAEDQDIVADLGRWWDDMSTRSPTYSRVGGIVSDLSSLDCVETAMPTQVPSSSQHGTAAHASCRCHVSCSFDQYSFHVHDSCRSQIIPKPLVFMPPGKILTPPGRDMDQAGRHNEGLYAMRRRWRKISGPCTDLQNRQVCCQQIGRLRRVWRRLRVGSVVLPWHSDSL